VPARIDDLKRIQEKFDDSRACKADSHDAREMKKRHWRQLRRELIENLYCEIRGASEAGTF
jgi:hypothetical protein